MFSRTQILTSFWSHLNFVTNHYVLLGTNQLKMEVFLIFMRQVSTFDLSFVKMDIRQESDRHSDVVDAITQADRLEGKLNLKSLSLDAVILISILHT